MRAADRSGARIAVVAGDRDIEAGTVGVKDLATGTQVDISVDSLVAEVITRLARTGQPRSRFVRCQPAGHRSVLAKLIAASACAWLI